MFTLLEILLVAALLLLVLLAALSASMSTPPTAAIDTHDVLHAGDNDRPDKVKTDGAPPFPIGNPLAGALPGQYQPTTSRVARTMHVASTPE